MKLMGGAKLSWRKIIILFIYLFSYLFIYLFWDN